MTPCYSISDTACVTCLCSMVCLAAKRRIHGLQIRESVIKQIHYLVLANKRADRGIYRRVPVRIMDAQLTSY